VVAGTATAGTDYTTNGSVLISFSIGQTSKTYTVTIIGDTVPEADETFFLNLSNPSGAVIADAQGVGTILDDEPMVINVADVTTLEGDSGATPAVFTLTLSKPSAVPVSVNYRVHGVTAFDDIDLAIGTGTVTFAPGETSKTVTVALYGDTITEANETYQLILSGATNATLARQWADGTIQNDDSTPTLSVYDPFMSEGNSGTSSMVFTVSLTPGATGPVTVDYSTADLLNNAVAGVDYIATSGTLTFAPGETSKTVTVTVIGDVLEEYTEQVYLNLSNPVGAPVADAQGMGYIANDDTARFTVDDLTVVEGNAGTTYAAVTVRLTNPSILDLYVNYATSGSTAMLIPGVDYTPTSGTLTIPAGSTTATVLVAVAGDLLDEPNETFFLNLTGGTNASILDSQGAVTIADDDTTTYSVSDATVTETDAGGQWVTVTVTGSNPNANPDSLTYAVVGGTATAGADFSSASGTLNFAIGETVKTISVYVYGDTADEPDETILVNIRGAFYGVIGDGVAVDVHGDRLHGLADGEVQRAARTREVRARGRRAADHRVCQRVRVGVRVRPGDGHRHPLAARVGLRHGGIAHRVSGGVVVGDGDRALRIEDGGVRPASQVQEERLVRLVEQVAGDRDQHRRRGRTGRDGEGAAGRSVVHPGMSIAVLPLVA